MAALAVSWRSPFLGVWDDEMVSREGGGAAAAAVVGEGEKVASSCFPFCRGKHYFYSLSRLKLAYVPLLCSFCSSDCYNLNQMLWYWWLQCCYNCRYCCTGYSCTAVTASVSMMLLSKLFFAFTANVIAFLGRVGLGLLSVPETSPFPPVLILLLLPMPPLGRRRWRRSHGVGVGVGVHDRGGGGGGPCGGEGEDGGDTRGG